MDSRHDDSLSDSSHRDDSSVSLDVCDTTPLSPRKSPSFDLANTTTGSGAEGKVYFVSRSEATGCKMAAADSPTRRVKDGSWQWKISIIAAFVLFSVVVLIAVSFSMRSMQCQDNDDIRKNILDMYKPFFMTQSDADKMLKDMRKQDSVGKHAAIKEVPNVPQYNCTMTEPKVGRNLADLPVGDTEEDITYHGCCETSHSMRMYHYLPNKDGVQFKIVQFKSHNQHFFLDNCMHTMHCPIPCQCMQMERHVMAVVADDDLKNVRLEWVMYLGTCKCINIGTR